MSERLFAATAVMIVREVEQDLQVRQPIERPSRQRIGQFDGLLIEARALRPLKR
jgi:hypothetical protein